MSTHELKSKIGKDLVQAQVRANLVNVRPTTRFAFDCPKDVDESIVVAPSPLHLYAMQRLLEKSP